MKVPSLRFSFVGVDCVFKLIESVLIGSMKDHCETKGVVYIVDRGDQCLDCVFKLIFFMMLEFFVMLEPKSTCATTL